MTASEQVTFTAGGPTMQCVEFTVVGDDIQEEQESFFVQVLSISSPVTLSPAGASVVIIDDDQGMYAAQ